jgi:hypothetical protein
VKTTLLVSLWLLGLIVAGYSSGVLLHEARAFNTWNTDHYRKLPWRAGITHYVNTLPGECPHCAGQEANTYAIDFDLYYAPVDAVSQGYRYSFQDLDCAGQTYIQVSSYYYVAYKHMSEGYQADQQTLMQGQLIGRSGNTGSEDNTPNKLCSSGPHLHVQMDSSPNSGPLPILPLSGYSSLSHYTGYMSDNAGVGDVCDFSNCTESSILGSDHYTVFRDGFTNAGGFYGVGTPWDPCGSPGNSGGGCWWVHQWCNGWVQDFRGQGQNDGNPAGVLMQKTGVNAAYWIHGYFWDRYIGLGGGAGPTPPETDSCGSTITASRYTAKTSRTDGTYGGAITKAQQSTSVPHQISVTHPDR